MYSEYVMKRFFDIVVSGLALLLLWPLILIFAILIRTDSRGPVFFCQIRMGRNFRPFRLWKLRTMTHGSSGAEVTIKGDPRITRIGKFLRATKLDELPQLWNVFCGDMSFVGPRPEVEHFVKQFRPAYEEILQLRPGMTDPASIKYRHEAELLGAVSDPQRYYVDVILPDKIRINKEYVHSQGLGADIVIILRTFAVLFRKEESTSVTFSK
jgi:lipopolysaccharide/colanic/teichoic acid biosynthesis glycosyltransferase